MNIIQKIKNFISLKVKQFLDPEIDHNVKPGDIWEFHNSKNPFCKKIKYLVWEVKDDYVLYSHYDIPGDSKYSDTVHYFKLGATLIHREEKKDE